MTSVATKITASFEDPEVKFWQECRKRSAELGIPAWKLAEDNFMHSFIDRSTKNR
jgi:hypothetical protein